MWTTRTHSCLPVGGHVKPGEDPRVTIVRELKKEFGLDVDPEAVGPPIMVTVTETVGLTSGHTDVSLWCAVKGSRDAPLAFNPKEFNQLRRFTFAQVPRHRSESHLQRFLAKVARTDA